MQTKLNNYFKLTIKHNELSKKCFIYDPENTKAYFDYKPLDTDTFISTVTKNKIKLYYRSPTIPIVIPLYPKIQTNASVPLLKSNLQKAIRRNEAEIAVSSALAIIQKEPMEFLRRLPIIYIEDVCLINSYPISVWLMMASEYSLTNLDIHILLNIVYNLCLVQDYYDNARSHNCNRNVFKISHEYLETHAQETVFNSLLSLYYRSEYGGMKGDMLMLRNSIYYYYNNPEQIMLSMELNPGIQFNINECKILNEAIDFHPFPHIIQSLIKQTGLEFEEIKICIWFAESGVNFRKKETLDNSKIYLEGETWKKIKYKLNIIRFHLLQ